MILGIDWSLRSTGLAILGDDGDTDTCTIKTPTEDGSIRAIADRIEFIADKVESWADLADGDSVFMEDLLLHSRSKYRSKMIAGWWATASRVARAVHDPVTVIPAKTRALYATGDGGSKKPAVVAAVLERYPQFTVRNDDEADAVILVAIGARLLGRPIDPDLPETHLAALQPKTKGK